MTIRDASARALVHRLLARTRHGEVILRDQGAVRTFGRMDTDDPLQATITINDAALYRSVLRGSIGVAQSYADGLWDVDDMVVLIRIVARNMYRFDHVRR